MPSTPPTPPSRLPFPSIGELIRSHRTLRGMTVEELARAVELAPSAIRSLEGGARLPLSKKHIGALARELELDGTEREMLGLAALISSPVMSGILGDGKGKERPALPALTASILAFLIADVRGYTRYTQEEGDAAAAALATRFAGVARSVVERWDGRVVELRGDEALCVFGSLRQACQAALALQERYATELELPVGIGLDVGEAVPVDEGYRGAALNRAARLCSLAAAGEILTTTGAVYVAPKIEGVAFRERGTLPLKGFEAPFEVLAIVREVSVPEVIPPA